MKFLTKINILLSVLLLLVLIVILLQNQISYLENETMSSNEGVEENFITNITKQDIINDCTNLSLEDTANCLVKNVKKIYKYNVTNDSINLSFEELVTLGGDCRNYAFLYEKLSNELGFEGNSFHIPKHRFAVISKDGDFCILNLKRTECFI